MISFQKGSGQNSDLLCDLRHEILSAQLHGQRLGGKMSTVSLERLTKVYANGQPVVNGLDLTIGEGEFVVLVGPSGCGKTTTLRMVAGLEEISDGILKIGEKVVNNISTRDRDIAMVFQNYALYPHMTVADNIGFALKLRKVPKEEIRSKVLAAAGILGLTDQLDRKPGQLSGGQRQRVAMGRAIVRDPAVFLMDEPLSNLDANLRVKMRAEVSRVQRQLGVATLYVTHDQIEAMTMGDRVAVMHSGDLQQCDHPQQLYKCPANLFVASFIGSPSMNIFEGSLSTDGTELALGSQKLSLDPIHTPRSLAPYRGRKIAVGFRPEGLSMTQVSEPGCTLKADVEIIEALGSEILVYFNFDATRVRVAGVASEEEPESEGSQTTSTWASGLGVARIPPTFQLTQGDRIELSLDRSKLHFFDLDTTLAIRDLSS